MAKERRASWRRKQATIQVPNLQHVQYGQHSDATPCMHANMVSLRSQHAAR